MEDDFLASGPALTNSNYVTWAAVMKVHLQARGLWDAIDGDAKGPVDPSTDCRALAAIHRAISRRILSKIDGKETAKEAWQALRTLRLGTEPMKRAKVRAFRQELEAVRMKDPETVGDFVDRVTALVFNIRAHDGGEVEEGYLVRKILRAVSPKFSQIALVIEVLCDLESMTVDGLVDRLKAYEIQMEDEWKLR
ncbi:unnamed protein product [Urochloa decumbens]|uniref:DUF4219 domain-containing protein n=1 Tax=Urochloa decumbens TaxID=240449 RepID=A0ABC8YM65_9POAL